MKILILILLFQILAGQNLFKLESVQAKKKGGYQYLFPKKFNFGKPFDTHKDTDDEETAEIQDEMPIVEDIPPAPTPVRDHRTI